MSRSPSEPKFTRLNSEDRRAALIQAGLACMARGGIQEFTVDKICAEAGVSRGLIRHHFGSMNALLAAVYSSIYNDPARLSGARREGQSRISHLLESIFAPEVFNREVLTIWLTLWGQASLNPELSAGHRVEYSAYHNDVAKALEETARANGRTADVAALARGLICMIDGLGIQHCIDPDSMPAESAMAVCRAMLEPAVGPY